MFNLSAMPPWHRVGKVGAVLALVCVQTALAFAQNPQAVRIRGTIAKVDGAMLTVRARDGSDIDVRLADTVAVSTVVRASLSDIKPNVYVGTAAVPQTDGTLRALEVLIFPEAMRGAGEGHSAWDLLPVSTMTNATVTESVDAVNGRSLTLKYKNGQKTVVVPEEAPIVTFVPGGRSDLRPGETVFMGVQQQPDGVLQAARVTVSKNGVVPPM